MKTFIFSSLFLILSTSTNLLAQKAPPSVKDSTIAKQADTKIINSKEDNSRNVMLNAANNTTPRDVNIGLPANVGGITVLENDLPVVYLFWPELPTSTWRQSVGLERSGLLKMEQLALTVGELGFAVNSYSQTGTQTLVTKSKITGNHFGWFQGDVNVSGPLLKNGWTYTVGAFINNDPGTFNLKFRKNIDETKIFRVGITKYFNDDKGKITTLYKYANSFSFSTNYAVFEYGPKGSVKELDYFQIGTGSYVVSDGRIKMINSLTGDPYWYTLGSDGTSSTSHNFDLFGNYKFNNGWNFKFSSRLHFSKASTNAIFPLSITPSSPSAGYIIADTGQPYSGNVGTQLALNSPQIPITSFQARLVLSKIINKHQLTIGLLQQYYNIDKYISNRSFFAQAVANQPQRLSGGGTGRDIDGFYNYNVGAEYHNGIENKLSLYAEDEWKASDRFNLTYGVTIRNNIIDGDYSPTPRSPGFTFKNADFKQIKENWIQFGGIVKATYNLHKNFGLIFNAQYTEENRRLESWSLAEAPKTGKIRSPLGAFGIFWNNKYIQLVSQATILTRNDYLQRFNLVNPSNPTQSDAFTTYYNINTVGWTTDFIATPFKGFSLHYLITLQNPIYQNFKFSAFGQDYDYSGKNVLSIAKVLMEIDPSYTINKFRIWASFRYFSEQYANLTNVLYFAPRWETFGGVNYSINNNVNAGIAVVNFLNQRGASGTINGAELINDPEPYYGRLLTGTYIMPFSVQFSVNINL